MKKKAVFTGPEGKMQIRNFYSGLLTYWFTPNNQSYLETSYGETFVISSGAEADFPVVLLHGSGSNSAMWAEEAAILSKQYRVYALDIPGECGNSCEYRLPWTGSSLSGWLCEVLSSLNIEKCILVGCSLGGWIATDYALRFPDKVKSLVLLAPAGFTPVKMSTVFRIMMLTFTGKKGREKIAELIYHGRKPGEEERLFASLASKYFIPSREILPLFSDEQLRSIKPPLLYLGGDHDCFYNSFAAVDRLEGLLPGAEVRILENTGHVLSGNGEIIYEFLKNTVNESV